MLQESKTNELEYQRLSKEEMEQRGILGRLVGICASFTAPTRNGRKYPEQLWENVFNDPIMKERIENGVCYGELGHPADREETDMEKIAVCMAEQPKKGKDGKLRAVFDILNTPNGRILKSLCDYGSTLGISSRGSGDLETDFDGQESVNPDTYNCEGFDVVLIPAVKEARLQYVTEALDKKRYNKTLREKLTESINKETEENRKVISESLSTLGVTLNESNDSEYHRLEKLYKNKKSFNDKQKQSGEIADITEYLDSHNMSYEIYDDKTDNGCTIFYDGEVIIKESIELSKDWKTLQPGQIVRFKSTEFDGVMEYDCEVSEVYDDHVILTPLDDKLSDMHLWIDDDMVDGILNESISLKEASLSPEDKMDLWHNGQRRENIAACGDSKLLKYKEICEYKGYDKEIDIINKELQKRGLLNDEDSPSPSVHEQEGKLTAKMEDGELLILANKSGVAFLKQYRTQPYDTEQLLKGWERYFVIRKSDKDANEIAQGIISTLNESYIIRTLSEAFNLSEASFGGYKYKYGVNAYPSGRNIILGGSDDLEAAIEIGVNQAQRICENPWMSNQQKIDYLQTIYISDDDAEEAIDTELDEKIEQLIAKLDSDLNEQITPNSDDINVNSDSAADNDGALVEELQNTLSVNKQLQDKIIDLQEKLSVSYTKEMSLKEELNQERLKNVKLSESVEKIDTLNNQISSAKKTEITLNKKFTNLTESIERKNAKIQQLVEQLANSEKQVTHLQTELKNSKSELTETTHNLTDITEKYNTLNTNYQQMKESYSKKVEKQNNLVEKYRNVAVKSVNRYIDSQATKLGITSAEIKNRLPESYSFSDIDRVCESLQEYKLNMTNLPFSTDKSLKEGINIKAYNIDNRTLIPMEEDVDDLTLRLAGIK